MLDFQQQFIELAMQQEALRFGEFTLKSGRVSPYFFNAGLFHGGVALKVFGECYAAAIQNANLEFDMLFGPAYKGIPLVSATSIALAARGHDYPYCFNRKEVKAHGEGGMLVGAPLAGKVMLVDDVITAGTAFREAKDLIEASGAEVAGVVVALDRQERGLGERSAIQEIQEDLKIPVVSIISLDDVVEFVAAMDPETVKKIEAYRAKFGA